MRSVNRREFLESSLLAAGAVLVGVRSSEAAILPGVESKAVPLITGEERNAQKDIWALEVNFKPIRMLTVELPDQKTGKTSKTLIWYLAYRAFNRPETAPPKLTDESGEPPMFVPEFTLVAEHGGKQKIYLDRVMPIAQAAINKRERHKYKNSVEIVGPLPPASRAGAKSEKSLDGVAMWRGVDPDVAYLKIFMTGFSNGYRVEKAPNGMDIVQRKTLVQNYWRPGDRFEQNEDEIRQVDAAKWIYR